MGAGLGEVAAVADNEMGGSRSGQRFSETRAGEHEQALAWESVRNGHDLVSG